MKKKEEFEKMKSITSQIDFAAIHGKLSDITSEKIKEALKRDLFSVYALVTELLSDEECIDAIVAVFMKKVEAAKVKASQPEIEFPAEEGGKHGE